MKLASFLKTKPQKLWVKILLIGFGIGLFISFWSLLAFFLDATYAFPGPLLTFQALGKVALKSSTYLAILVSFTRLLIGFVAGFLVGYLFGILAGLYKPLAYIFSPLIILARSLPISAVILVLIIFTTRQVEFGVFIMTFPIIYTFTKEGIDKIPNKLLDLMNLEGFYKINTIGRITIPLSFRSTLVGSSMALGLSLKAELMGEILGGTSSSKTGLGNLIYISKNIDFDIPALFAYVIISLLIIIIFDLGGYFIKTLYLKSESPTKGA